MIKILLHIVLASLLLFALPLHAAEQPGAPSPATNSSWEDLERAPSLYESPYRISLFSAPHGEDRARLWSQTMSIGAYGVGVAGLAAMAGLRDRPARQSRRAAGAETRLGDGELRPR